MSDVTRILGAIEDGDKAQHWNSRGHFFAAAAEAMRRVLVDNARRRASRKHGGGRERLELPEIGGPAASDPIDLLDLDEALGKLEERYPEKAQVVKLRFFAGLSLAETARSLGLSRATVERNWAYARAWLYRQLRSK
jgi:RNA polymerase sigma factor (TIGR02999 family)